jgi:5,5'-dehydrodivanillate O-demethylase
VWEDKVAANASDYTDFAHTGPGTLAGRYLRHFWQPIAIAHDLPPGRAKPVRIMGEDFTLYRGERRAGTAQSSVLGPQSSPAHLVAFRCAHRGTQLSTGWVEGDEIRCFYHGWKYDGSGQCTEQPAEPEPFCSRIKIKAYPVQEYLGLIFAYLGEGAGGEGEAPPLPRYPSFEEEGVRQVSTYIRECNFFQNLENYVDEVHVAFTHRVSHFADHGLYVVPRISAEETDWGVTVYAQRPGDLVRATAIGMPNIGNVAGGAPPSEEEGWSEFIAWRVPIDDERHVSFNVNMTHIKGEAAERLRQRQSERRPAPPGESASVAAARILRGELEWSDVESRPDIVNVQDNAAQVGQGLIADRTHERLGSSDAGIVLLRRIWARELQAFAEGKPLKKWERTQRVQAMSGGVPSAKPTTQVAV